MKPESTQGRIEFVDGKNQDKTASTNEILRISNKEVETNIIVMETKKIDGILGADFQVELMLKAG